MIERPKLAPVMLVALALALGALAFAGYGQDAYGQEAADGEAAGDALAASAGVFTEAQAELGAEIYAASCAGCHGATLGGGFGPRLRPLDPAVYLDQPLSVVFAYMRTSMPYDAPGSLAVEDYAAVLAYVLQESGYPYGEEPLPADDEALDAIVLDEAPTE